MAKLFTRGDSQYYYCYFSIKDPKTKKRKTFQESTGCSKKTEVEQYLLTRIEQERRSILNNELPIITLIDAIDEYIDNKISKLSSKHAAETIYKALFDYFGEHYFFNDIDTKAIQNFKTKKYGQIAASSWNRYLAEISAIYNYIKGYYLVAIIDFSKLKERIDPPKTICLNMEEVKKLLNISCNNHQHRHLYKFILISLLRAKTEYCIKYKG